MKPGRELDALIAEKVMGLTIPYIPLGCSRPVEIPHYSTSIEAVWEVVEKLKLTVYTPGSSFADGEYANGGWYEDQYSAENLQGNREYGKTAPHAICLAALEAVGVRVFENVADESDRESDKEKASSEVQD